MKTKIVAVIVLLIVLSDRLYSQERANDTLIKLCKSEVDNINNMTLYKGYLMYGNDAHSIESSVGMEYEDYDWTPACVYYDSEGRIRKYADVNETVDGGGKHVNIMYFDETGSLCCNLYSDVDQGQMLHGKMYVYNSTVLRFEGSAYSMDYNDGEWRDFLYLDNPFPIKINEYEFAIRNVEDIKNWLRIDDISMPDGCLKVRFRTPQINDTVVISGKDVLIRENPSTISRIVARNSTGGFVSVSGVMSKENIGKFGTHNWYKIQQDLYETGDRKQTGYLFGAFVEPVEQIVTP
jgi:hypothetical protein